MKKSLHKGSEKHLNNLEDNDYFMPKWEEVIIFGFVGALCGKFILEWGVKEFAPELIPKLFPNPWTSIIIGVVVGIGWYYKRRLKVKFLRFKKWFH